VTGLEPAPISGTRSKRAVSTIPPHGQFLFFPILDLFNNLGSSIVFPHIEMTPKDSNVEPFDRSVFFEIPYPPPYLV
jgi:hypothetical protein